MYLVLSAVGSLTGIIGTQILPFPAVLFSFGAQVGLHQTAFTGLDYQTEDLLPRPQPDRLQQNNTKVTVTLTGQLHYTFKYLCTNS